MKKLISVILGFLLFFNLIPGNLSVSATGIKKIIKSSYFFVDTENHTYTGKKIKPKVKSKLKKNKDYAVSYENNINVGTATITITGKGKYAGKITKTFKIIRKTINKKDFKVNTSKYIYTGTRRRPEINSSLKLNTDYTVSYSNNKNVGTATVTITGKGNYKGTIKKTFKITAKKITASDFTLSSDTFEYTGKAVKPSVKSSLKLDTDYKIEYDNNYELGTAKVIITGKGNCKGTVTKSFKIVRRSISKGDFTISLEDKTYTGEEIKPNIRGKLFEGTDYTVSYSNNINVGIATITIKGIGNYTGIITSTFKIVAKELKNSNFSLTTTSYTYTSKSITPNVSSDLILNTDYTISCSNNVNVGTATVTITGKGNYSGTVTKTFKIVAKSLNATEFSLSGTSYIFTSKAITPSVKSSLKLNTDYTVNYKNNVNVGTATVTITGKGNYSGTVTKTFKITAPTVDKVSSLTLTLSGKKIINKWSKVSGATGYEVYRKAKGGESYIKVKTVTDGTSYTTVALSADKYYVKVRAYKKIGSTKFYGSFSDVKSIIVN